MDYELKRSDRKSMAIKITPDGRIVVCVPKKTTQQNADAFVECNRKWIEAALTKTEQRRKNAEKYTINENDIPAYIQKAKDYLPVRTAYWAEIMNLQPSYIHVTRAEKRYGSCNAKKGICFSYRLMAYPADVIDYVIIHELAHIKHLDHSAAFYALVEKYMPDYRKKQNILQHKEK